MLWLNTYKVKDLPEPKKPVEDPKPEIIGDFYVRLGMAVAAWQFVEHSLIHTYARIVNAKNYKALAASFHIPVSFKARLDMTNAAIEQADLPKEYPTKWKKLYKSAGEKSKRRNEIAHSLVIFDPSKKTSQQMFLVKSVFNPATTIKLTKQSSIITMKELEELKNGFEKLHKDIVDFDQSLSKAGFVYKT